LGARVCLIDDDVLVLEAMAVGLRDAGYDVVTAPGAAAGLDILQRVGADVIVTDMNMPGTSGAQLIAEARFHWPAIPIIAISGASTADHGSVLDAARGLGASACLAKPFRLAQLKAALGRVLAAKDADAPVRHL
jgi:DNA-binding response OmpR family regulator